MRSRRLVPLLILLIVAPFLVYAWAAIDAARDIARREALTRNLATAQLGARLVGEQNGDAVDYLRSVARHHGFRRALVERDRPALRRQLEEARRLNEEFASVAAYAPGGPLLAISPRSAARPPAGARLPPDATAAGYLRDASHGRVAESGASPGGDRRKPLAEHRLVVLEGAFFPRLDRLKVRSDARERAEERMDPLRGLDARKVGELDDRLEQRAIV